MRTASTKVAIVGGGISGLAVAYELAKRAIEADIPLDIRVIEQSAFVGGNADTAVFSLGITKGFDRGDGGIEYVRWADLGVNDMNVNAYTYLTAAMEEMGFFRRDDPAPDHLKPLENTECYFTKDGSLHITDDDNLKFGVTNPAFSFKNLNSGAPYALKKIVDKVAKDHYLIEEPEDPDDLAKYNLDLTLGAFFQNALSNPLEFFRKYGDDLGKIDRQWRTDEGLQRLCRRVIFLRDNIYYPRISAMYFADDNGPEAMLLAAPFQYYATQEGVGKKEPDRRYFAGGSQKWIEYLKEYLEENLGKKSPLVRVEIRTDFGPAKVNVRQESITVDGYPEVFDYCVMGTHADGAAQALQFAYSSHKTIENQKSLIDKESAVRTILDKISYTNSIAVVHTFAGLLPPNRSCWRTYNVLVRSGYSLKPYSITYVCNRHQNDAAEELYNHVNLPQFFVTLNPQIPIPESYIMQKVPISAIPDRLKALLPEKTLKLAAKSTWTEDAENRAIARFRHNLLNKDCFVAQELLNEYHKTEDQLFFTGGWTRGSGLHEECWHQGIVVAKKILSTIACLRTNAGRAETASEST